MVIELEAIIFIAAVIALLVAIIFILFSISTLVNAAGIDHAGDCSIQQFPYIQWCNDYKMQQMWNEMLERAMEWNNTH